MPSIPYSEEDPITESDFEQGWSSYLAACEHLLAEVGQGWPTIEDGFELAEYGYLAKEESTKGTRRHIIPLYDHMRDNNPFAPLFDCYASKDSSDLRPCLPAHAGFSVRLGHSSNSFPLAQAQRNALTHQLLSQAGEILAVNGPPGTGKTTLLLSVVASLWAQAALEGGEPPVILAASTNNHAVTNIIDAFGKDFSKGAGPLADRWLPEVKSFGAYFPSLNQEATRAQKYQTHNFFDKVESSDYVTAAEMAYLQAAARAFPDIAVESLTVEKIVTALQDAIRKEAEKLKLIEDAWLALEDARAALREELGSDPHTSLTTRQQQLVRSEEEKGVAEELLEKWEKYLAKESIFYSLLSWIRPIAQKRMRRARVFLKEEQAPEHIYEGRQSIEDIEAAIRANVDRLKHAVEEYKVHLRRGEEFVRGEQERLARWHSALALLGIAANREHVSLAECDIFADTHTRFIIFLLTTHYWEGRWLLEMQAALPTLEKEKNKTGRKTLEKRWRRRMKLTPCVVSTFFMLPSLLKARRHDEGDFADDYLYDFADLLMVDEAGQVLPEVAGSSFALCKKALVIGDTFQIEPIWSIPARVDIGNLLSTGLIAEENNDEAYEQFSGTGKSAASGSVMRIAQRVTHYQSDSDLARGLFLYEHRRCFERMPVNS